jgi:hypothetical protein
MARTPMPTHQDHRVFISYAHRDGVELADRLQKGLTSRGFDVWVDRQRLAGGAVWTGDIERAIDERQVTLALLTPGSYESEICRAEQLRTLRKGKRLIPVIAAKGTDFPLHLETRQYRDLTDPVAYAERFQELVADITSNVTATLSKSLSVAATVTCLWKNALKSARFRAIMVTGVRARKGIKIGLLDLRACR